MVNRVIVVLTVTTILVLFSFSPFFKRPATPKRVEISKEATSTSTIREEVWDASSSGEVVTVTRVINGDTIEVEGGKRVRYIGMDTPEMGDGRKGAACFAGEATEENKRLVDGKTVRLEKDVSETDQYGRLLRFARVATFPPDVRH